MTISLAKGDNLSLAKEAPGVTLFKAGLGWDVRATDGAAFDLDASAFAVGADGKVASNDAFCFYGQPSILGGAVSTSGDNTTGAGDGADETITIDTATLPADIERVVIVVTIHEAEKRSQSFGQVRAAWINVADQGGTEYARYDLGEDASTETAMVFGEVYRHNGDWKFRAVGQGYAGGLQAVAEQHGVRF